ncbi:hypothetical protein [Methylomicrobium lacus]|uniref:hypothetical protein n=1 Tax=Methylomicrobium lacus TaxID=136992 RepID=UPI0035A947FC
MTTVPVILRRLLGFIVLVATIGLATCQTLVKAFPTGADYAAESALTRRSQAE